MERERDRDLVDNLKIIDGAWLLDRALFMRTKLGTPAAAFWLEKQGVSFEIGVIALVGSMRARYYGVHVGNINSREWRHADHMRIE